MSPRPTDPAALRRLCRHLRVKTDYYENDREGRPEHLDCPEFPWCDLTAREVGPDDGPVHREDCAPGRRCFDPVLGPEA
jgi:hypothetical protein